MPINRGGGVRGDSGVVARPGKRIGAQRSMITTSSPLPFRSRPFSTYNASISGVTKDSQGAALGGCTIQLFRTSDDLFLGEVVSDGSGNYSITPTPNVGGPYYIVAYKAGGTDVAGTTVNTLQTQ